MKKSLLVLLLLNSSVYANDVSDFTAQAQKIQSLEGELQQLELETKIAKLKEGLGLLSAPSIVDEESMPNNDIIPEPVSDISDLSLKYIVNNGRHSVLYFNSSNGLHKLTVGEKYNDWKLKRVQGKYVFSKGSETVEVL